MNEKMTTEDWDRKLKQQSEESAEYRHRLYERVDLKNSKKILDIGCGTGAILRDMAEITNGQITGIDIDEKKLKIAGEYTADLDNVKLMKGDMSDIPFDDHTFDLVTFHIVLVYVKDQKKAIEECVRVTKPGGYILASLEPDYEGDIQFPEDPARDIHLRWMESLGADLRCGRKLKFLYASAGLKTEVGMESESQYIHVRDDRKKLKMFREQRWALEKMLEDAGWPPERIEGYLLKQEDLIFRGLKFHFPTAFYAIGIVPYDRSSRDDILR